MLQDYTTCFKKKIKKLRRFFSDPFIHFLYRIRKIENGNKLALTSKGVNNLNLGKNIIVPDFCFFVGYIKIGDYTTLGVYNFFAGDIEIGKYCQIGANVAIHASNHPIDYATIYINQNLLGGKMQQFKSSKKVTVGNDVWIGHGVIILQGVIIGDGAIVGAGSVVTKDVEPYTIVAGNPAKLIKKRFSDKIISELLEIRWWDRPKQFIKDNEKFFLTNFNSIESIKEIINY